MTTKKQKGMIGEAVFRVKNSLCTGREWEKLFEDGDNNTNAVILGLIQEVERDSNFSIQVEKQSKWNGNMPQEVSQYAKYKNLISGASLPDTEPLEQFLNKIDYINRFESTPPDIDKWEYLNRYYIEPLVQLLEGLQDFNFEDD